MGIRKNSQVCHLRYSFKETDTEQEAENKISSLLEGDGNYITEQEKVNVANNYFEKCKKQLAKWDAKLAAGREVYADTTCMQPTTTSWDLRRFATRTIQGFGIPQAVPTGSYHQDVHTSPAVHQLNKDKAAAMAAMSFINKPSKQLSDVASQYGLGDVYHEKIMSLIADKKQTLKRAIHWTLKLFCRSYHTTYQW